MGFISCGFIWTTAGGWMAYVWQGPGTASQETRDDRGQHGGYGEREADQPVYGSGEIGTLESIKGRIFFF